MTEPAAPRCPFCEKTGLPILPLRYAVARTDYDGTRPSWKALELPAGFGDGVTGTALPSELARYTSRLLRPGYLYVFNEVRGEWKAYLVTGLGYLYEFDIETTTPPDADQIEFSCFRTGEEFIARCITIPDAASAGRVWLGFSDTAWTADVLARHKRQAYRERHMRAVDVGQWVGGNTNQPHTAEFAQLEAVVNEFAKEGVDHGQAPPPPTARYVTDPETGETFLQNDLPEVTIMGYPAFGFSPHRFHGFKHETPGLLEWAEQAAAPYAPMLVALPDPVGITMELAALMGARLNEFLEQDELQRPLAVSALLDSLKEAIRNNAGMDALRKAERDAEWRAHSWNYPYYISVRDGRNDLVNRHLDRLKNDRKYKQAWENKLKAARQAAADGLDADDLEEAADDAWNKYRKKLQDNEPENWRRTVFQPQLEDYDQQYLVPLAKAHQEWLRSEACAGAFECNHDEADADSGAGYVQTLLLCMQDTQQNKICFDNYQEWLEANTSDSRNLLQRALAYNQKDILEEWDKAVPSGGFPANQLPSMPWRSLIGLYGRSLRHLDAGGKNLVAQLITAVGGPIMKVLDTMIDQTAGRLLVALGVVAESSIEVIQHVGKLDDALDVVVAWMKELNPDALGDIDAGLLKRQLEVQSRGRRQSGRVRDAQGRITAGRVTLRVNRFALKQIEGGLVGDEAAARASRTVLRMDEWPKNGLARFRRMFDSNARLAVVGLILQVVGARKMAAGMDESMAHQRTESVWRFRSSMAAIVGGVGNLIHDGIVNGAKAGSVKLARAASSTWTKALGVISRGLGVVAAGLIAVLDARNAVLEQQKGNVGMMWLYTFSAIAGFGAALLFSGWLGATVFGLSASGVGIILVLVGIAIALLIDFLKNNELQDWMERCLFGAIEKGKRYQELAEEMREFELAMKALGLNPEEEESETGTVPALQAG
ncbi:T6SS effector BTH_I2691 family protein [Luteimonas sp. RD2P54]|uniref:T6SS effector BTH_I2691 family protein n=1 Tax=Luteimonas endophytica TaxID=3042023 RepID=A0ABT6J676_9GAMM|nr:T6SS effector BTH_I2691 family protein [Luteimonas endophytica]MDH5822332.1 T6SS effector BTH_I2691 family protein [Luteimonas endophytica]